MLEYSLTESEEKEIPSDNEFVELANLSRVNNFFSFFLSKKLSFTLKSSFEKNLRYTNAK
jgi:hypothetical protein